MVQLVENHAVVAGDLLGVEDDAARPGFVSLRLCVREVQGIADMPNFFAGDVGRTIILTARRDSAVAKRRPGSIRLRARKTGPTTSFAEEEVVGR